LYPPPRPLSVGEVLDLSFRIYRRTFVKCLVFGALVVVANWLPHLYSIARGQTVAQSMIRPAQGAGYFVVFLVSMVMAFAFPVAIVCRQYKMATGQAIGGELLRTLRLLGRIVLAVVLLALLGIVCALPVLVALLATGMTRYVLVGLLLLPEGYVFLRLACTFTAMVVENTSAAASLGRSWELADGNVMRLTAMYTVAIFLLLVLYLVVGMLTTFLYAVFGRGDLAMVAAAVGVVTVAAGALASPYYSALGLAIFGDLLVRKEGADLAQRISAA
jgi:hypothetical protein